MRCSWVHDGAFVSRKTIILIGAAIFVIAGAGKLGLNALPFVKLDACRYFGPLINTTSEIRCTRLLHHLGENFAGALEIGKPEIFGSLFLAWVDSHD